MLMKLLLIKLLYIYDVRKNTCITENTCIEVAERLTVTLRIAGSIAPHGRNNLDDLQLWFRFWVFYVCQF